MAGQITPPATAMLLNALASAGQVAGLAHSIPASDAPTLANIDEVSSPGYTRKSVVWGSATTESPAVTNTEVVTFGPTTEDMPPAAFAFLTDVTSGSTLDRPTDLALGTKEATGGSLASGQYYWAVTALNSRGETDASDEVSAAITLGETQPLTWDAVSGATSYNVYRGLNPGAENTLVANVATASYTDVGNEVADQTPPAINDASVADIFYVWELEEPVSALANRPIYVPVGAMIIE